MGTQFSSRFRSSDRRRILDGIRSAQDSVIGPKRRGRGVGLAEVSLSRTEKNKLGIAILAKVLSIAELHDFTGDFRKSEIFKEVLDWLMHLRSDAAFNGFQEITKEYELEQEANPVAELVRRLQKLTTRTKNKSRDPFRVAASSAAKRVLVSALIRAVPVSPDDSHAKKLGKGLADLTLDTIVTQYIKSFISEFLSSIMSRVDPNQTDSNIKAVIDLSEKTVEKIARRAVKRVIATGKLDDSPSIQKIVLEEIISLIEQKKEPKQAEQVL